GFRDDLSGQVDAFFALREEYVRMGVAHRRGMLFTGPPGNGKTSALRIIASLRDEPFILHRMHNRTDTDELDTAFDKAANEAPAILVFEDVDSLFDASCLSHFLNRIDGIQPLEGVLILATTNHPEKLDPALTERPSRFDRLFHFGNPGPRERRIFLKQGLESIFDERLVTATEDFSMAQLKEVRVSACLEAIHEGLSVPTLDGAFRAVERLRGQRGIVERGGAAERTIGFQWIRGSPTQTAKGRSDVE
ncbi:MAG TPA: ATP-binding protein, partial [Planctomycetota bacterium]|nr:ATP-binding protein [Planctomycetota bacterium]